MNPPDMTVIYFWNNSAASGRSDGRSRQFYAILLADKSKHLQTVYHDRTALHIGMARSLLDRITAIPKYIPNQRDVTTQNNGV